MAKHASRYIDHLSILLSKANPYEVPSCDSVARYSERNLDRPHFPSHHHTGRRDEDQEDEATLRPRTYEKTGEPPQEAPREEYRFEEAGMVRQGRWIQ